MSSSAVQVYSCLLSFEMSMAFYTALYNCTELTNKCSRTKVRYTLFGAADGGQDLHLRVPVTAQGAGILAAKPSPVAGKGARASDTHLEF